MVASNHLSTSYASLFRTYVGQNLKKGTDCEGRPRDYVRHDVLVSYWTQQALNQILESTFGDRAVFITRMNLQTQYLRTFSILVYISNLDPRYLSEFNTLFHHKIGDRHLPSNEPSRLLDPKLWEAFDEYQWMFCPMQMIFDECTGVHLDPRCTFPGVEQSRQSLGRAEPLAVGPNDARFRFLSLEKALTLTGTRGPKRPTSLIVVKSYPSTGTSAYGNEAHFFLESEQSTRISPNIVRCLGLYDCDTSRDGLTHNIVLEYADKGSLYEYYQDQERPQTNLERRAFWTSMIPFLAGLEHAHNRSTLNRPGSSVHQDLKPANLLVFSGSDGPFDFTVKLCDFGLSMTKGQLGSTGPYKEGNSTFSAPERCLAYQVEYRADPAVDLYAAGGVLLDAAAWVGGGNEGRQHFIRLRNAEIRDEAHAMHQRGHSDSFHNGSSTLRCVREAEMSLSPHDGLTAAIAGLVLDKVLLADRKSRMPAGELLKALEALIVQNTKSQIPLLSIQEGDSIRRLSVGSQDSSHGSPFDENTRSPPGAKRPDTPEVKKTLPFLSFSEVMNWKESSKTIPLPGEDVAWRHLKDRDHILVVDNSKSMQAHREKLQKTFRPLAYLLKQFDRDGVEIMLTSDCEIRKFEKSAQMESYIKDNFQKGKDGHCETEILFDDLFDKIRKQIRETDSIGRVHDKLLNMLRRPVSRSVSIYFLTDGAWAEDDKEWGLTEALGNSLISFGKDVQEAPKNKRRRVSLQFIRFGDHPSGISILNKFDKLLPPDQDFIDHKPIDSGVWHLLVGSLMPSIDDD